jgi:DNA-binding NarL/FixJ family response regulator
MPITDTRVLVVEDDTFTRTTVCDALRFHGVTIVGDAGSAADAMAIAATEDLDVALLDLDLGGGPSGIDLARALRREHPGIGIVILTTYEDPRLVRKSFDTLPDDVIYLVKRELSDSNALPQALQAARDRVGTVSPVAARTIGAVGTTAGLTEVQIEVMRLVAEGHSNGAIARERVVTEGAIEKLVHRTARQLGITSTSDQNLRVQITRAYLNLTGAPVRDEA